MSLGQSTGEGAVRPYGLESVLQEQRYIMLYHWLGNLMENQVFIFTAGNL
jgi:hypothetical protein